MAAPHHEGPFATVIGDEDMLQPTPRRLVWLLVGLAAAVVLGFVIGLTAPRRRSARYPEAL